MDALVHHGGRQHVADDHEEVHERAGEVGEQDAMGHYGNDATGKAGGGPVGEAAYHGGHERGIVGQPRHTGQQRELHEREQHRDGAEQRDGHEHAGGPAVRVGQGTLGRGSLRGAHGACSSRVVGGLVGHGNHLLPARHLVCADSPSPRQKENEPV